MSINVAFWFIHQLLQYGKHEQAISIPATTNRQHRPTGSIFEDADLKAYIATPASDTEGYYRHVIAEKFAFEND